MKSRLRALALNAMLPGLLLAAPLLHAEEYRLTVEPSYPVEQAEDVYRPLLQYLSSSTGHTFRLHVPRNYHFHWRDMRQNAPTDFAFEEAHFTDYRAQRFGFTPVARTAEPTRYALLAKPEFAEEGQEGLIGRRVACMPSPSLGFALLVERYTNPVAQPDIRSEAISWRDGVDIVFAGEAEGAIVPGFIADLYPNLVTVAESREFPGTAMSAAPSVPEEVRTAVRDALLALHDDPEAGRVLAELGATHFEAATAADYAGSEQMLRGFFGYEQPGAASEIAPPATAD